MSKAVSRGQALEVSARFGTQVDWDQLDGERLQKDVINLSSEEFGRRFTSFLKNGARIVFDRLRIATAPFNPTEFFKGGNRTFWKGSKDGDGLKGEEERDWASFTFAEVDFTAVDFLTCLEDGENYITGEEKLARLKKLDRTLFGANVFAGLWLNYQSCQNKTESVLEKLYQRSDTACIEFFGDILRNSDGRRSILLFYRNIDGSWNRHIIRLDDVNCNSLHFAMVAFSGS